MIRRLLSLLLCASLLLSALPVPAMADSEAEIHRYALMISDNGWDEACRMASAMGGYLAHIDSQPEYDELIAEIVELDYQDVRFWIGARRIADQAGETAFYWVDGENNPDDMPIDFDAALAGYDPWAIDAPLSEPGCDWVALSYSGEERRWTLANAENDVPAALSGRNGYIVEFSAMTAENSVPLYETIEDEALREEARAVAEAPLAYGTVLPIGDGDPASIYRAGSGPQGSNAAAATPPNAESIRPYMPDEIDSAPGQDEAEKQNCVITGLRLEDNTIRLSASTDEACYLTVSFVREAEDYVPLARGAKGEAVRELQTRLNELGYSVGAADGDFGGKTETALAAYQQDAGLEPTGAADADTYYRLLPEKTPFDPLGGEVFLTAYFDVAGGLEMDSLSFDLTDEMMKADWPEHFVIRARLEPAGAEYVCILYTRAYEIFSSRTVDDFAGRNVINFDEDKGSNYGVLAEGVKTARSVGGVNAVTASDDGKTCVIVNIDDTVASLQPGDVLLLDMEEGEDLMVGVSRVDIGGGTAILVYDAEDFGLRDFYETLSVSVGRASAMLGWGVDQPADNANYDVQFDKTITRSLSTSVEIKPLTVKVEGKTDYSFSFMFDVKLFKNDYYTSSFRSKTSVTITAEAKVEAGSKSITEKMNAALEEGETPLKPFEVSIFNVEAPTNIPGLTFGISASVPIEFAFSGSGTISYTVESEKGFDYDSLGGAKEISRKDSHVDVKLEGKATLDIGVKLTASVKFAGKLVDLSASLKAGAKVTASVSKEFRLYSEVSQPSKHGCWVCADWKAQGYITFGVTLKCTLTKNLSATPIDWKPVKITWDLAKGYVSILNAQDSAFHGLPHCGIGTCPNKQYRVTFVLKSDPAQKDAGRGVSVTNVDVPGATNETSVGGILYLYPGAYTAKAAGSSRETAFAVNEEARVVYLEDVDKGGLIGSVRDEDTGAPIVGASVTISIGGKKATKTTNGDGEVSFDKLDAAAAALHTTCKGYEPDDRRVTVEPGAPSSAGVIFLKKSPTGSLKGTVRDEETDEPIADATVTATSDTNRQETATDRNGEFEFPELEPGDYTLHIERDDFKSKDDQEVSILPGEETEAGVVYASKPNYLAIRGIIRDIYQQEGFKALKGKAEHSGSGYTIIYCVQYWIELTDPVVYDDGEGHEITLPAGEWVALKTLKFELWDVLCAYCEGEALCAVKGNLQPYTEVSPDEEDEKLFMQWEELGLIDGHKKDGDGWLIHDSLLKSWVKYRSYLYDVKAAFEIMLTEVEPVGDRP